MSLIFFDSFKNYTFLPLKWEECTKDCQFYITEGVGRKGGSALSIYSGYTDVYYDHLGKKLGGNYEEIIVGFAFKKVKHDFGYIEIDFNDGDTIQSKIRLFNDNFMWYIADESIQQGLNYSLQFNEWNYFEAKIKTHTVSGTVDIRINEYTALSLQDLATASTTNNYIDKVRFRLRHYIDTDEDYAYIEDLYIADTAGDTNNGFLGNCEISTVYPISQGSYNQFELAPTYSGVENYTLIDEYIHQEDDTVTYNDTFLMYHANDCGNYYSTSFWSGGTVSNYYDLSNLVNSMWLRFSGVNIPKNAKILTVSLQIYIESRYTSASYGRVDYSRFQKSSTPVTQPTSISDFTSRSFTNASVPFTMYQTSPTTLNYKDPLQELVSMFDWQEQDNIILFSFNQLYFDGGSSGTDKLRIRNYAYSNDPFHANSPKLYVEWQLPGGDRDEYVKSENLDNKETYNLNTISGSSEIFAINHNIFAKRKFDTANTDDMCLNSIVKIGVTTYSGVKLLPTDRTYTCSNFIIEKNPNTGISWISSDISDNEFGFVTTSSG